MSPFGQVFLGGAAGESDWRQRIAIPRLRAANITWFDPQVPPDEWTSAHEDRDMRAKEAAVVLLFVLNAQTRGVATIAEIAHSLGAGRKLAIALEEIPEGASVQGESIGVREAADLNRGRLFVRSMAAAHGVPVFDNVAGAVDHAIRLLAPCPLTERGLQTLLDAVEFGPCRFVAAAHGEAFLLRIHATIPDVHTGRPTCFTGREWHIPAAATEAEVLRIAWMAALAWQEHETREQFRYRGHPLFPPH